MACLGTVLSLLLCVKESVLKCILNVDIWNWGQISAVALTLAIWVVFLLTCPQNCDLPHCKPPGMALAWLAFVSGWCDPLNVMGQGSDMCFATQLVLSSLKAAPSLSAEQLPGQKFSGKLNIMFQSALSDQSKKHRSAFSILLKYVICSYQYSFGQLLQSNAGIKH